MALRRGAELLRAGVDVGGTFTDVVVLEDGVVRVAKVLTRVSRPWESVVEGVKRLAPISRVGLLVHATTLGTNMLLGQVGLEKPQVVLLTSRGFRDVVEIGRQARPEAYNAFFTKPEPLVPRNMRFELPIRIYRDGVSGEWDSIEEELKRIVLSTCSDNVVYVVALINCFVDRGASEHRLASLVRKYCREALDVVTSCEVDPRPGEYERTSSAVIEAILRPLFRRYIGMLSESLRKEGFRGGIFVMQSSGGVAPLNAALEHPVYFIESGPAAGSIAASVYARVRGDELVVAFDMGGTTAKASTIVEGEPLILEYFEVGGRYHAGRLVRGSGYPLRIPHIDLVEVSAGGGTIIWVDKGGSLRVGPLSAGADPGPVCYGRGGREPTVTDAHAALGRLPPLLAGGVIELDVEAAVKSLEKLALSLGVTWVEAAAEALRLANTEMSRALRLVTVERGLDPSSAVLYAFGGAGPLHAVELAEELGVENVYIPAYAGVFSAVGLLVAPRRMSDNLGLRGEIDGVLGEARGLAEERASRLASMLACRDWDASIVLSVGFRGQSEPIRLRLKLDDFARLDSKALEAMALNLYRESYGYLPPEPRPPLVVTSVTLTVTCMDYTDVPRAAAGGVESGRRRVYFLSDGWMEATVYHGVPRRVVGPAVIETDTTTILVPRGWRGETDEYGGLLLTRA